MAKVGVRTAAETKQSEPQTCEEYVEAIFEILGSELEAWSRVKEAAGGEYTPARLQKEHVLKALDPSVRTKKERACFKCGLRKIYRELASRKSSPARFLVSRIVLTGGKIGRSTAPNTQTQALDTRETRGL